MNTLRVFSLMLTWKRQSGIDIHVTKFSDIGANATDPVIIKNHISGCLPQLGNTTNLCFGCRR